jgi:hypothetical protein
MIEAKLVDFQVRALQRMLENVPKKLRSTILKKELKLGAMHLVAPMRAATPAKTGKLKTSVKVRAQKRTIKSVGFVAGYTRKGNKGRGFYGAFLEWGWRSGRRKSAREVLGGRKKRRLTSDERAKVDLVNNSRVKQPGRFILAKVAVRKGPAIMMRVINAVSKRVEAEAKNA